MRIILTTLFSMFMMSTVAQAKCSTTGCTGPVTMLYISNEINVVIDSNVSTITTCTPVGGKYLQVSANPEKRKEQYATLLAAKLTGATVYARIINGSPVCEIAYLLLL